MLCMYLTELISYYYFLVVGVKIIVIYDLALDSGKPYITSMMYDYIWKK